MRIGSSLIIISLLLSITNSCKTSKRSTTTQTVDVNNASQQEQRPAVQSLSIKHFSGVKFGSPSEKQGANELMLVSNNFPNSNTTQVTIKRKATVKDLNYVTEDLAINLNARNFSYIPEVAEFWLKPGQIFSALSFISGRPTIVTIPRNPTQLTISLSGVANSSSLAQNPEQSSQLLKTENYLIAQKANPPSANLSFSFNKIHSAEELEFKLTGKYRDALGSFPGEIGLNAGSQPKHHYYMLEFQQNMFSIQSDEMLPAKVFKQPIADMSDYVFINKINYGRRAIIIFKSAQTLEELGITAAENYYSGLTEEKMRAAYTQLSKKKEVEVFARFYGGSSSSVIRSMENTVRRGVPDIFTYIRSAPVDHQLALPIGYTLMNMNNQVVGQKSNKTQRVTTTTPKIKTDQVVDQKNNNNTQTATTKTPVKLYKLKVTLTDIQCILARDGAYETDDYALQQYIVYKALGKDKKFVSRDINKFSDRIDAVGQVPNILNPVIISDMKNQIHVKEESRMEARNRNMISNSLVFHITQDELKDPNASFKIFTWLKEYSSTKFGSNDDKVLINNTSISVKVKEVIEILSGSKNLNANTRFPIFIVGSGYKFHNFGSGNMHLTNIQKIKPLVLEGPIAVELSNTAVAVWIQFELLE